MRKIRVLVVDDSVVYRRLLATILSGDSLIEVATAANGRIALQKIPQFAPDLVTLDMEMPVMSGLETLAHMREDHPAIPTIMFSSLTMRGASATFDALSAGAVDYVAKPTGTTSPEQSAQLVRDTLLPKIRSLCADKVGVKDSARPTRGVRHPARTPMKRPATRLNVVAIGISTGGPNALASLFADFPPDLPVPIVMVQHMPPVFTRLLAERLSAKSQVDVHEGEEGMLVESGHAYMAPGDHHMQVVRVDGQVRLHLQQEQPENSCRPAVDVLFRSVANVYGGAALGVVMTGMGMDGLRGCEALSAELCPIYVQDEETSVVWGMPGFVSRAGLADKVLPLTHIAPEIVRATGRGRRPSIAMHRSGT